MELTHEPIRLHVATRIHQAATLLLGDAGAISILDIYKQLVEPPNPAVGDFAFGCFLLAKVLKQPPPAVAKKLEESLGQDPYISVAKATGPYLNLTLTGNALGETVLAPILKQESFRRKFTSDNPRTMIEYSQPNTHKELHVGHMRNMCLGHSLVLMLRYAGHDVVASTFPGDQGTHVAKCLWYMKYHNQEAAPLTHKGEWLGRMYSKAHLKLEDDNGTPQEAINREELTQILKQLEAKKGEFYDLWVETRQWSIDLMKSVYAWAGIHFDIWYYESEVDAASMALAQKLLSDGKLVRSEGAVGMDLEAENLGFCMLLKTDGTGLYATKDVELARRKFEDYKIEKNIYVVDVRQALHFKQVFKVLEKIGFEQAQKCFHLQYNFVELPDGAMSSRKGNIVPLTDLVHQMEQMVKDQYLSRYNGEWPESEVNEVATRVAMGAINYGMLKMDTNKKIVFDMAEWLKLDGESGPFIQYSYARIRSLVAKVSGVANVPGEENVAVNLEKVQWDLLKEPAERVLATSLMHFNSTVISAAETYKPSSLCTYLYELAKKFNSFYHDCPISKAPSPEIRDMRLALSQATGLVLKQGLALLAIPVPERM